MKITIKNICSVQIRDLKPNTIKVVEADKNGIIQDFYWRRRQKDNDGSLEFIKECKCKKEKPKKEEKLKVKAENKKEVKNNKKQEDN